MELTRLLRKPRKRNEIGFSYRYPNQIEAQRSGFDLERKKEPMDMELSRLLHKPRKRNGIGFF